MTSWSVVMTATGPRPEKPQFIPPNNYDYTPTRITFHDVVEAPTRHEAFTRTLDSATRLFGSTKVAVDFLFIERNEP